MKLYPGKRSGIILLLNVANSDQLDCVADEALAAVVGNRAPKACLPTLTKWNATALDRVKALIAKPDAAGIDAAFAPGFKRDELLTFFNDCNARYGDCTDAAVLATADNGSARVRLTCAKKPANVLIAANPATSIIELLYVAP